MKFSNETLNVLKNFSQINPSIIIEPGSSLKTIKNDSTIIAEANVSEDFPSQAAIMDLNQFLSTVELFEDPDIEWTDTYVNVNGGVNHGKVRYLLTNADIARSIKSGNNAKINMPPEDISFQLTQSDMEDIKKAASILRLPEIGIVGDGAAQYLKILDSDNDTTNSYEKRIGVTSHTFRMLFRVENWQFLPGDYDVKISKKGIAFFENDLVKYWLTTEMGSDFTG